ncbi:UV-endonuclease UvdE-domain-containing protein [Mycena rebaudengoi]|nr:UV-endonuclease UvdE-domain-containing protein [Mycena rebaudengoi]
MSCVLRFVALRNRYIPPHHHQFLRLGAQLMVTSARRLSSRLQARLGDDSGPVSGRTESKITSSAGEKRKRTSTAASCHEPPTSDVDEVSAKPAKKARQPKVEPTYIIPDVIRKETTFKGRLGYACLNTVLRNKKPANDSDSIFCSRTCRLDSIEKNGIEWLKDLGRKNTEDLLKMIEWNENNNIRFLCISTDLFPYASHAVHGYSLDYCAPLLARVGELANRLGHRLTAHPGQYTQLGSPNPDVVQSSVRELAYHSEMMDRMGLDVDSVFVIHGGGVYGDKVETLSRIRRLLWISFLRTSEAV